MDLEQLAYFLAVAGERPVTRAGRRTHRRTPPSRPAVAPPPIPAAQIHWTPCRGWDICTTYRGSVPRGWAAAGCRSAMMGG
jgi:hypothetical protein